MGGLGTSRAKGFRLWGPPVLSTPLPSTPPTTALLQPFSFPADPVLQWGDGLSPLFPAPHKPGLGLKVSLATLAVLPLPTLH